MRKALPADARAKRSEAIAAQVRSLPEWASARTVAAYVAMRGEADPQPLVDAAFLDGKTVALPFVDWASETMKFRAFGAGDALHESGMGFEQPSEHSPVIDAVEIDVVLVPALAVDERGYRIGWGKGFYDRVLPSLPNARRLALVFDFQLLAEVPETAGDVPVHVIVTDRNVVRV